MKMKNETTAQEKQQALFVELHRKVDTILKNPRYGNDFSKVVNEVYERIENEKKKLLVKR
jgi:hypothetical protein